MGARGGLQWFALLEKQQRRGGQQRGISWQPPVPFQSCMAKENRCVPSACSTCPHAPTSSRGGQRLPTVPSVHFPSECIDTCTGNP